MIKYKLICEKNHEFESWFADSREFDNLKRRNLLDCIFCSSKNIKKSIMSPMISNVKKIKEKNNDFDILLKNEKKRLFQIRKYVEKNFEYVDKNFSQKVRDIYYDKKNKKTIYGITTPEERKELAEEGIDLLSIPWVDKDN
tara:strand:+ start:654 stop:1076 length:423 start_codon:yes stop_codon:yes gene_type:complete